MNARPRPSGRGSPLRQFSPASAALTGRGIGVPCTRLANLILAPKQERQRIGARFGQSIVTD
jgi:hypothetical protein